jgi:hypothetical protein
LDTEFGEMWGTGKCAERFSWEISRKAITWCTQDEIENIQSDVKYLM